MDLEEKMNKEFKEMGDKNEQILQIMHMIADATGDTGLQLVACSRQFGEKCSKIAFEQLNKEESEKINFDSVINLINQANQMLDDLVTE